MLGHTALAEPNILWTKVENSTGGWGKNERFRIERERVMEHGCSRKARACARVLRPWGREHWERKASRDGFA